MKPPALPFLAAPVCGAVLAVCVHSFSTTTSSSSPASTPYVVKSPSSPARPGAPAPASAHQTGHTLSALLHLPPGYPPLSDQDAARISGLATADLHDLLGQLAPKEGELMPAANSLKPAILRAAIAELYRRDSTAAMEWAQTRGNDRSSIVVALITEASLHDPELAGNWVMRLKDDPAFASRSDSRYAAAIKANAPLSGAEATLALEQLLSQGGLKSNSGNQVPAYAENFDFALYAKNSSSSAAVQDAVLYWTAKDPEAAWTSLRDTLPEKPDLFTAMAAGIASQQGEAAAAQWASAHLDDLPAGARADLLRSLATAMPVRYSVTEAAALDSGPIAGPPKIEGRLTALMSALGNDEDRIALAAASFSQIIAFRSSITALQLLPTPELQLQALVASAETTPPKSSNFRGRPPTWDDYQRAMDRLQFSPEAQATVRAVFPPGK